MTVYSSGVELPRPSFFTLRQKSIARSLALSLGAFGLSLRLAGFPHIEDLRGSGWQIIPLAICLGGMAEMIRCLNRRWNLYHAGILLLLYANLMILAMIVFLLVYP